MIDPQRLFNPSVLINFHRATLYTNLQKSVYRRVAHYAFICLLSLPIALSAQTQLGEDIDGESTYDEFGSSVSLSADGKRLAVGARSNNGNGFDSGHVRVFQWSASNWEQLGANINGEAAYDASGGSVDLSHDGNRLAIGAMYNDGNGFDAGHVRVYQWSGTDWQQIGADIDGEAAYDQFGSSVAFSADANRLAIGARKNDGNGFESGHVRVFEWSNNDWVQLGSDIDGEAPYDESGGAVALSSDGNRLAIGARYNDGNGFDSGHTRVYQWSNQAWTQVGSDIDGEAFGDLFGTSVSLSSSGDRLAIGATLNINDNGMNAGHVQVFEWLGSAWVQVGQDINGEAAYDESGGSVSLSSEGTHLAIGAYFNDGNGPNSGHARLYQWTGTTWTQAGTDMDGEAAEDVSGNSVSLSQYGNHLAIGALWNDGNGPDSGHARVYDVSTLNAFALNAGLNDAWYNSGTDGQGFFITIFPDIGIASLAWFTYDTELPPEGAQANLGDPGHRWFTATGQIDGNQAMMNIEMTSGGLFDTSTDIERTDPPGSDGTIVLTFYHCNAGTVDYDIPSIDRRGTVHIKRVANDNIVMCEALMAD